MSIKNSYGDNIVPHKNFNGQTVIIIGAGLAGCEAAWFLANKGVAITLLECKGLSLGPAQTIHTFAELVCSNSLKSTRTESAHGILKSEMSKLNSLVLSVANNPQIKVPAGEALAVDRNLFSKKITELIKTHPLITTIEKEVYDPLEELAIYKADYIIIACGPLATNSISNWIKNCMQTDDIYFYDAIAPIVDSKSLDYSKLFWQNRQRSYNLTDKKTASTSAPDPASAPASSPAEAPAEDYLNIPLSKDQYYNFVDNLISAQKVPSRDFEEYHFFEGCMPIDALAERGRDTLRCSCMKPGGLGVDRNVAAIVQLRKENLQGDALNLVGFQTRLTFSEQARIFRTLPGLVQAHFLRYGQVHRNTFIYAKNLLDFDLRSKQFPNIYFAGQISGV
ncbi:MAG: methylenetetrahydrofolate--tRNA-(uracil(54)-C(5))-methyltransferase (FADH(2)-oxidizing) TrmFO, partial [Oligoflexia bacterium]|nr:methylenetetrahydrofolate--tRNA-(uracil(54)-C(5))-methyltransferase (FADH(2)-oxidizing) TrmFO [Oligoflexia bacterium]